MPWQSLISDGGVRISNKCVIDGDLYVGGSIWGGCNTSVFQSGSFTSSNVVPINSLSNAIGTINLIDGAVTVSKLNLTVGNLGIGTNAPMSLLHVNGGDLTVTQGNIVAQNTSLFYGNIGTTSQPFITSLPNLASVGNVTSSNLTVIGNITGNVSTSSQPSITSLPNLVSVGTLSNLTVSGNINGNISTSSQPYIRSLPNLTSLGTLSNLTVSGNISGNISTSSQPYITSLPNLTSLGSNTNVQLNTTLDVQSNKIINTVNIGRTIWSQQIVNTISNYGTIQIPVNSYTLGYNVTNYRFSISFTYLGESAMIFSGVFNVGAVGPLIQLQFFTLNTSTGATNSTPVLICPLINTNLQSNINPQYGTVSNIVSGTGIQNTLSNWYTMNFKWSLTSLVLGQSYILAFTDVQNQNAGTFTYSLANSTIVVQS